MKKIKVLHITFEMKLGGTQQVIRQLIDGLDNDAVENRILCIDGIVGELGEILTEQGIDVVTYRRENGLDRKLIRFIRDYLKTNDIDIVHCHQYSPYIYGVFGALFTKAKIIFTEHGRFYPERSSWKRKLVNPILSWITTSITAISSATAHALSQYENFPLKKIKVIYNGLKLDSELVTEQSEIDALKAEVGIPPSAFVIGTIARLDPIKNHELVIKAVAELKQTIPNLHFLLIGDGERKASLTQLVNAEKVQDKVTFTGFIVKPQRYISTMDVFVLPSFSEGTSMTLLESMAYEKPSIVTNVGGNPEIVNDRETGIVIENDNLPQFVSAVHCLYEEEALRSKLGLAAHSRYQKLFREQRMVSEYLNLYKNLVNG